MRKKYKNHSKTNDKKVLMASVAVLLLLLLIVVLVIMKNYNKMSKKSKIGNNSTSQEIVDYVFNISSYDAEVDVEIKSNKNSNKYKLRQIYKDKENNSQEVIEPSNISGLKMVREGNDLKIENTKLNISKVINDYKDISNNNLDLISFIDSYKNNEKSNYRDENNQIIMETIIDTNNYQKYGTLYVSKENGKPIKLEVRDTNQNVIIYIIYNEININTNKISNMEEYAINIFSKKVEI